MTNPWTNPDALPADALAGLAAFIDARSLLPDQAAAHAALVAALGPQPGEHLLDFGCGTGPVARRLAPLVAPGGSVIGADISRGLLAFAGRQPVQAGLHYAWLAPDQPAFADERFDGMTAARVLMHTNEPLPVLVQLHRWLRPGGRLALLEMDWGSLMVDHSDRRLTRRILDWRTDTVDGDNWMGRQLANRALDAGFARVEVTLLPTAGRDGATTHFGAVRRAGDLALQAAVIGADDHARWVGELDARLAHGRFFAAHTEVIALAFKQTS